jgi:hypothetical protein
MHVTTILLSCVMHVKHKYEYYDIETPLLGNDREISNDATAVAK